MRLRVYVDGFNLYYGALRARPAARWLDLAALSHLLRPGDTIDAIRYFTARVKGDRDATAQASRSSTSLLSAPCHWSRSTSVSSGPTLLRCPLRSRDRARGAPLESSRPRRRARTSTLRRTCSWMGWTISTSRPWSSRMTPISRLRSGRRTVASAPSMSSVRVARHRRQLDRRRRIRCHTRVPRGHRSTGVALGRVVAVAASSPLRPQHPQATCVGLTIDGQSRFSAMERLRGALKAPRCRYRAALCTLSTHEPRRGVAQR